MRKKIEEMYLKIGFPDLEAQFFSWFTAVGIVIALMIRVACGMYDANDPKECRANSINDVLLSPAYALGCNLAKNRFDLKLN